MYFKPSIPRQYESDNSDDFIYQLNPVILILKIFGLLPFYIRNSAYKLNDANKYGRIYTTFIRLVILITSGLIFYGYIEFKLINLGKNEGNTDHINQWIEIFLCMTTYIMTLLICSYYTEDHIKNLNNILNVDKEILDYFGVKIKTKCKRFSFYVLIIFGYHFYICGINIYALIDTYNNLVASSTLNLSRLISFYLNLFIYTYENIIGAIFIIFLSGILYVVCIRFNYVNLVLQDCVISENNNKRRTNDVLFAFKLHTKLTNIMREINDLSGVILLAFMGYSFYKITTDSYNSFIEFNKFYAKNQELASPIVLQHCAAWLGLNVFLLVIITSVCGQITEQANVTSNIIARSYGKDKMYKSIIDKFLTKSINQELEFTAYGFFAIDKSTLFTIFSAVTTYLVILIQFKQLESGA